MWEGPVGIQRRKQKLHKRKLKRDKIELKERIHIQHVAKREYFWIEDTKDEKDTKDEQDPKDANRPNI